MTAATTPILRVENLTKCYGTTCILKGASLNLGKGEIKVLIDSSVQKASAGGQLADEAGRTMSEIVGSVQQVSAMMGEIHAAARDQSAGIAQINQSVGQLDQMTQQNAALVEESAAAAGTVTEQAQRLAKVVAVFALSRGA